jgi:hypothetical protein
MTIKKKHWLWILTFTLLGSLSWFRFTYPQFAFIQLSVDRPKALAIAKDFLIQKEQINASSYKTATIFGLASSADQFLQKAVGFQDERQFLQKHDFELFFWTTRFFREAEKEEYAITLSAATGQVIGFSHVIKDSDSRPWRSQDESREKVFRFLQKKFGVKAEDFIINTEHAKKYDNRTDYSFSWRKKDVFIRWSQEPDSGGAKLLTGATISGDDILTFRKIQMEIPDQFNRFIDQQLNVGRNLGILFRMIFYALLTAATFYVVVRRNDLVMHVTKNFALTLTASLFILYLLEYFNEYENILFSYPTTSTFAEFIWRKTSNFFLDAFIVTLGILMPCLAGESLHYEVLKERREGSFLHYLTSSFWTRNIFSAVLLGYCGAVIMIGLQSAAFEIGQRFFGIWVEHFWMAQTSVGYFPFLVAFVIGYSASFTEEIAFRIFSISLGKKFLKNTFLAILIAAMMWGFGHTSYRVFPMWFRGLEVTILGVFLGLFYLRFGIIPVLVTHYLFDVFWNSAVFLVGHSTSFSFYTSLAVLLLPLLLGGIAYLINRPEEDRPMTWRLTKHQLFNLQILKHFLKDHPMLQGRSPGELKKEIAEHGWDIAVVEKAIEDLTAGQD